MASNIVQTYNQGGEKVYPIVLVDSFQYKNQRGYAAYRVLVNEIVNQSTSRMTIPTLITDVVSPLVPERGITVNGDVYITGTLRGGIRWNAIPQPSNVSGD